METELLIVKYIDILSGVMRQSMEEYREQPPYRELFRLTMTQLHYLHIIKLREQITFSDLAEIFHVQKPTVTNIVNRLIEKNYVEKEQSQTDLRIFHLRLTANGKKLLDLENKGYYDFAKKITNCLTEEEKHRFTQILEKTATRLQNQ